MKKIFKNYKTSIAGLLGTIGMGFKHTENLTLQNVGELLITTSILLLGFGAKDFDKDVKN